MIQREIFFGVIINTFSKNHPRALHEEFICKQNISQSTAFGVGERTHLHISTTPEGTQYLQLISGNDFS